MKILQIEIVNFRQYRKPQTIKISTDNKKHITVIQGDNGRGKSNLMNAITWCLYGVELITSKNDKLGIVNESEAYSNPKGKTTCMVSVTIGEDTPEYEFVRHQDFFLLGNLIKSEDPILTGYKISKEKGRSQLGDPEYYINKYFIPESLKNFFFFDGEKLFEHFKDTQKLKEYIEDLSQIEILNKALNTAKGVNKVICDERKKSGTGETTIAKYDELCKKIENNERLLGDEIIKKGRLDAEIAEKDEFLRSNSNNKVQEYQKEREELSRRRTRESNIKSEAENKIRSLLGNMIAPMYASRALSKTKDLIEENTEKGVLPPKIKDTFIRDLLESETCICGRSLERGSQCRIILENLLNEMVASDIANDAVDGKYRINNILQKLNFENEYSELSDDVQKADNELDAIKEALAEISEKISVFDIDEIKEAERDRRILIDERDKCVVNISEYKDSKDKAEKEKETMSRSVAEIKKKNAKIDELEKQKNYLEDIVEKIKYIKDSLVEDVRKQLQTEVRKYYAEMISKSSNDTEISIIDNGEQYKLSVKSEHKNEKIGSLSAGEKQVLALSMTAAMYTICKIDAPVLIDTPMGRISGDARDNISNYLPRYLEGTQLIFLPTDTEYTPNVREKLLPYVGKEYKIIYDDDKKESEVINYE